MLNPKKISKIGIGTWGIGGFMERDESIDEQKQIDALAYMLDNGMNFVEANMWYSQGYSVEILAKALKQSSIKREDLFICQAIYIKENKDFEESIKEINQLLDLFNTDYVDTLQFSMGSFLRSSFEKITEWIDRQFDDGKIRYTSITNEDLLFLKKYHQKYQEKLFSHEVVFNFEVRVNESLGIIPYAQQNNIETVVYQPLRRNNTAQRNWEPLVKLQQKYDKTQNQIIMNWIVSKGYLPITKSETIEHIDEHLASLEFKMEPKDLELLDTYVIPGYTAPEIDFRKTGKGISIDQISNEFDEIYGN